MLDDSMATSNAETAAKSTSPAQSIGTKWYQCITVEPMMFLYMFAFQLTSVIEQAFFVHKACQVNHNYSAEICNNLTQHADINKEVQVKSCATFFFFFNYVRIALNSYLSSGFWGCAYREQYRRFINGIIFPVMWCQLWSHYFWVHGQIDEVVNYHCCSDWSESSSTLWRSFWMHFMVRNKQTKEET